MGGIVSLGGRLPRVYLFAVFSLFPLALILDWLPCQSPRTFVLADGFFFKFHFCGKGYWLGVQASLGCLLCRLLLFPLALILDWLPFPIVLADACFIFARRVPSWGVFCAVFSLFPGSFSTGFLASLRGRRRALGFLPLPRLRIRLAKSNAKDGFRVLGFLGRRAPRSGRGIMEYGCRRQTCSAFYLRRGFVCLSALWQGSFFSLWDGFVPADGFFFNFHFCGGRDIRSAGAFLGVSSLCRLLIVFRLRSFSTGLPCPVSEDVCPCGRLFLI